MFVENSSFVLAPGEALNAPEFDAVFVFVLTVRPAFWIFAASLKSTIASALYVSLGASVTLVLSQENSPTQQPASDASISSRDIALFKKYQSFLWEI